MGKVEIRRTFDIIVGCFPFSFLYVRQPLLKANKKSADAENSLKKKLVKSVNRLKLEYYSI